MLERLAHRPKKLEPLARSEMVLFVELIDGHPVI
jgi:hypothetical protein